MPTHTDIQKQIATLTAAMRGANVSVRSALQGQITALRAELDALGDEAATSQTLAVNQTQSAAIDVASLSDQAITLFRVLCEPQFALDDVRELAGQVSIDWLSLPGEDIPAKARALVRVCQDRGQLDGLQARMLAARPELHDRLVA
jgi:hypothetical protein